MLTKLAIRNVKRSIRDYVLYVITITLIVALMFSFNSMLFSDLIVGMNPRMADYKALLVVFSFFVLIVVAWLINYMTKFMLERRSKEFGTYLILGMENKDVSKLFFYENTLLGVISLVAGTFFGVFVYQGLLVAVTTFFGQEYQLSADVNVGAILLTSLYYAVIQFIVAFRNNRYLRKLKVYDLVNADKRNEDVKVKNIARSVVVFVLSIVAALVSITNAPVIIILICMILFIYGFYIGISGTLALIISKTKSFKYKKTNLFVFRQLSSKINTMGFTMGTIAVLFTLALLCCNYALSLSTFREETARYAPFDISITSLSTDEKFEDVADMLQKDGWVDKDLSYYIYRGEDAKFKKVILDNDITGGFFKYDTYMKVSDYNALRGFLGLKNISLNNDEYIIHSVASVSEYYNSYVKKNPEIAINGKQYKCKQICNEDFGQNGQNGAGYVIVVPDVVAESMDVYYSQYACKTLKETDNDLYVKLQDYVKQDAEYWATSSGDDTELDHGMGIDTAYTVYDNIMIKNGGCIAEVQAAIITVVTSISYIALVFICVALTILAVQQLSDSTKYKFRYKVLNNLGVDDRQKSKIIFKQLLIYFGCPIVIPIAISLVVSLKINQFMLTGTQILSSNYGLFMGALLVFLVIYSIYFIATYLGFKRNVEEER